MGISYGGISQLFAAQLDPPDLAAISPLSTIDATATTLYPGGDLNTGFAVAWAQQRQQEAEPAGPNSGQPYAYQQIQNGDTTCASNQVLHGEAADLMAKIQANSTYNPSVADPLDPITLRQQDQGPRVPRLPVGGRADRRPLSRSRPALHRHEPEMVHIHQRRPHRLARSGHAQPLVRLPRAVRGQTGRRYSIRRRSTPRRRSSTSRRWGFRRPIWSRFHRTRSSSSRRTRRHWQRSRPCPRCGCCSTTGPGSRRPGCSPRATPTPGSSSRSRSTRFRARRRRPGTSARAGRSAPPRRRPAGRIRTPRIASALPLNDFTGNTGTGGLWGNASQWTWNWQHNPSGTAVSYTSAPLTSNTTVIGQGAVTAWVKSSTPGRRPPGHDQRGQPERPGDVRPERVAPRE